MTDIVEILSHASYVLLAGFALVIIALLKPSKILIKQLLQLDLPTLGTKRSLILGVVGCVLIIIGLGGLYASSQIDSLPNIDKILRIPESPITAIKNGTLVTIHVEAVDQNDPDTNQVAKYLMQRSVYHPPQFVYTFYVKNPSMDSWERDQWGETNDKSYDFLWWVYPWNAGVNKILVNVSIKDNKNAKSTERCQEYVVVGKPEK